MISADSIWQDVLKIRAHAPLVHNITNYVVMNSTANALLALGASPVMAHAIDEVEQMVGITQALVINIGTLSRPWIKSMERAARAARQRGLPVVLDPVGVGATAFRTDTALRLLKTGACRIVRGNASEIFVLAGAAAKTKGVDSTMTSGAVVAQAWGLSARYGCIVSISGADDFILNKAACLKVSNGHALMPKVTGLGCTASALTGAFAAVNPNLLQAAAHGMAVMGIAGEIAAAAAGGPGSFQVYFLDALYNLSLDDIRLRLKAEAI